MPATLFADTKIDFGFPKGDFFKTIIEHLSFVNWGNSTISQLFKFK